MEELKEMLVSLRAEMQRISEEDKQREERFLVRIGVLESRIPIQKGRRKNSLRDYTTRSKVRKTSGASFIGLIKESRGDKEYLYILTPKPQRRSRLRRETEGDRDSIIAGDGSPATTALKNMNQREDKGVQLLINNDSDDEDNENENEESDNEEDDRMFHKVLASKPPYYTGKSKEIGDATNWLDTLEDIMALNIMVRTERRS